MKQEGIELFNSIPLEGAVLQLFVLHCTVVEAKFKHIYCTNARLKLHAHCVLFKGLRDETFSLFYNTLNPKSCIITLYIRVL